MSPCINCNYFILNLMKTILTSPGLPNLLKFVNLIKNSLKVLDDEVGEDGGKTSVEYDDVYTR